MYAWLILSSGSSTGLGGLWKHIGRDSLERLPNGQCINRNHTGWVREQAMMAIEAVVDKN